jgi:predicted  nucleic acid-binding Zn-ribbon protein
MLAKLRLNLSEHIDRKVEQTYKKYQSSKVKKLEQEIATLTAQEKALLRKLLPLQEKIETKKQEKTKLQRSLGNL